MKGLQMGFNAQGRMRAEQALKMRDTHSVPWFSEETRTRFQSEIRQFHLAEPRDSRFRPLREKPSHLEAGLETQRSSRVRG